MSATPDRRLERSIRRALLRKELRESRAATIAGFVIFLGLPIVWTCLFAVIDEKHEVFPGLAAGLFAGAGWVFAAVVAAQSVCRDFGRREGEFLLARPVTPADVIRAKGTVGFSLVLILALAVACWEFPLTVLDNIEDPGDGWQLWLFATLASVVAFWLAFAAAAITRQTLTGVLIAGVVLVALVVLPWMTAAPVEALVAVGPRMHGVFQALYERAFDMTESQARTAAWGAFELSSPYSGVGRPDLVSAAAAIGTLAIATLCALFKLLVERKRFWTRPTLGRISAQVLFFLLVYMILAYTIDTASVIPLTAFLLIWFAARVGRGVAAVAARSERVLGLGTKSIAWTIGLAMIVLFSLAMTEVGANLPVATTHWDRREFSLDEGRLVFWPPNRFAISDRKVAVSYGSPLLRVFDIDVAGRITGEPIALSFLEDENARRLRPATPVPLFDEQGELYVSLTELRDGHSGNDAPCQSRLARVDLENTRLFSSTDLHIAEDVPADYAYWAATGAAFGGDRLVVLYAAGNWGEGRPRAYRTRPAVAVTYERDEAGGFRVAQSISYTSYDVGYGLGWGRYLARGLDKRLYVVGAWEGPIDPGKPDGSWGHASPLSLVWPIEGTLPVDSEVILGADVWGFDVMTPGEPDAETVAWLAAQGRDSANAPTPVEVIGRVRFSPLAWSFRSSAPLLLAAGRDRVWEVHSASAICYDVSDLRHPRKIAHVTTYPNQNAIVGSKYLLLDHGLGFSLVRHPE